MTISGFQSPFEAKCSREILFTVHTSRRRPDSGLGEGAKVVSRFILDAPPKLREIHVSTVTAESGTMDLCSSTANKRRPADETPQQIEKP